MNIETEALGNAVILNPLSRTDQNRAPASRNSFLGIVDAAFVSLVA